MKRKLILIPIMSMILSLFGCSKKEEVIFPYRFATKEEAIELYTSNEDYFNNFSKYDLQYKTQSLDGTVESLIEFGQNQMLEFTKIEKEAIDQAMSEITQIIKDNGYTLPSLDTIVFVKSTQKEESDSGAYTHGTTIYLGESFVSIMLSNEEKYHQTVLYFLCHELFHCLTRCNPDFRSDMYNIIQFTVQDQEYQIPECIKDMFISNPDVEHHNSYATFKINGEDIDCFTALIATKPFEKEGDSFFNCMETALIPIDGSNVYYTSADASNFWEIFGKNTSYVIDPEECMADNFGYTISKGLDGDYQSPEIIESIIDYLKK